MKKVLALFLAFTLALSMAACGNGETSSTVENNSVAVGEPEASPESTVAPGSKGTIEFWTVFTGADGTSMQAMVDAYNATSPEYTVNHRAIEANDLYLKMPLAIQSGQDVPDLVINHIERLQAFEENGFLTDIKPYLDKAGISSANYNEKAWKMSDIGSGHYGVPLDVHSFVLYVNMDLYEQYGEKDLDDGVLTWDEIKAAGARLESTEIKPFGLTWLRAMFLSSYAQQGGTLSKDGAAPDFNNPEAQKVLETWMDLQKSGYILNESEQTWETFLGGKMLYCPEGQWMYNHVKQTGLNVKMFDFPVFDTTVKGNWTSSHQFVFPVNKDRDDEKTIATLKFIDYMGNNSIEWAKAGQTPAHNSIKDNPEFKDMPQAFLANENEELKIYDYKYYGYAVESVDKVLPEMLWGRMPLNDGFAQAVQETKDRIETES